MKRLVALIGMLLGTAAGAQPDDATIGDRATTLRISQAVQVDASSPTLRVYLDLLDAHGEAVSALAPEELSATIGESSATIESISALAASAEGVAYIFLVDISRSLAADEFDRIRGALDLWVASLGPSDRVAIIAFGEESRLVVDFTNDYAAARLALDGLGPTDNLTVFHRAVREGLDLARRRDAGLPGRRVLVVLTDGKDEGSGLTTSDLLSSLRADPVPIYAIGLSRLRSAAERRRFFGLLHRLATNSGGAYVEAAETTVEQSYAAMLGAVRRVWAVNLSCPECRLDGASHRLQINLTDGDRVLTHGRRVRLLPHSGPLAPSPAPASASGGEPGEEPPELTHPGDPAGAFDESQVDRGRTGSLERLWWVGAVILLAPALFLAWKRFGAVEARAEEVELEPEENEAQAEPPSAPRPYETAPGVLTSRPPKPPSLRMVRLIVVRGNRVGRQYSMMLLEKGVVGARSTCECVLVDEPNIEPVQFELYQVDGRVYIRDLARQRPTLVDGLPIEDRHRLDRESLVGNSDCILRVIYDEPRRVPL